MAEGDARFRLRRSAQEGVDWRYEGLFGPMDVRFDGETVTRLSGQATGEAELAWGRGTLTSLAERGTTKSDLLREGVQAMIAQRTVRIRQDGHGLLRPRRTLVVRGLEGEDLSIRLRRWDTLTLERGATPLVAQPSVARGRVYPPATAEDVALLVLVKLSGLARLVAL